MLHAKTCMELTGDDDLFPRFSSYRDYFKLYTLDKTSFQNLNIPVSIFIAEDDPVIPLEDFRALRDNDFLKIFRQQYGGHCGFIDLFPYSRWYNEIISECIKISIIGLIMDLTLLRKKDDFPLYVLGQLDRLPVDYREKHRSIAHSNSNGADHLEAGVVVLLHYNHSEYVFQLIKRSESVAQAGDISCPGGMLEQSTDEMLSHILLKTDIIRTIDNRTLDVLQNKDEQTVSLIRIFLMNALREAWEEIGLSPLNVGFLGALPSYSLTYFSTDDLSCRLSG